MRCRFGVQIERRDFVDLHSGILDEALHLREAPRRAREVG